MVSLQLKGVLNRGSNLYKKKFILVMQSFSKMLSVAYKNGWNRGFRVQNNSYDTLVMCDAEVVELQHLSLILVIFQAISGLCINWNRSHVYPINGVANCCSFF